MSPLDIDGMPVVLWKVGIGAIPRLAIPRLATESDQSRIFDAGACPKSYDWCYVYRVLCTKVSLCQGARTVPAWLMEWW